MNRYLLRAIIGVVLSQVCPTQIPAALPGETVILSPPSASGMETLAAREVRRYIYLRTGRLLPLATARSLRPQTGDAILVGRKDRPLIRGVLRHIPVTLESLPPQSYWLKTLNPETTAPNPRRLLVITGGDNQGTLYAAYRFAETLGIRFHLDDDVIPDGPMPWVLPTLDERSAPLFALRGIQPFHDFPEGPDWWNRDDYLAIIGQLPKLRMNFIGLHTYPEGHPNAEPTVWIGQTADIGKGDKVKFSYPASYQNTLRGNWGYAAKKTSDYIFGSATLFERDDFGPEVMFGFTPAPTSPEASNEVFERTGALLREAFTFAHQLGVQTCVGTETPLTIPKRVQDRLKARGKNPADFKTVQELYEGIFRRAAQAYPLDYYWFWTPEGWTWSGVEEEQITATTNDLFAAIAARNRVKPHFGFATCGWVLGPPQDRSLFDKVLPKPMALSCINRQVGYEPVDAGFAGVTGRSKWAIPWLEDDGALAAPELWAGRMRRDAADALRYGCDGLMGIHWRTRVLRPNVAALAQAAWDQTRWVDAYEAQILVTPTPRTAGPVGGQVAAFPDNPIADTAQAPLYQTVRYNLAAYHLPATNGPCQVTLKFCEPHYNAAGARVFDVRLQGQRVIQDLDIFARVGKNRALDFNFTNILVTNGWLDIDFVPRVEFPSIAALQIEGASFSARINCGGPAWGDYAADAAASSLPAPILPATQDFYEDWTGHEFGPEAGPGAAAIFERIDGQLPKPSTWVNGPGGIRPDGRPWAEVKKEYTFVEEFGALRPAVKGAGCQERFDYWLNTFAYLRTMGEVNCAWGQYNQVIQNVKQEKDALRQKELARQLALPARQKLVRLLDALYDHLLATVSTPGELGTVANWNQHNLPDLITKPGEELARILGEPLPPDAQPGKQYHGPGRVIVPTKRTCLRPKETSELKVVVLSETPPRAGALYWRKLGAEQFAKVPLLHVGRGVYSVPLPRGKDDFEYYIRVEPEQGGPAYFPATAPRQCQTVVVCAGR